MKKKGAVVKKQRTTNTHLTDENWESMVVAVPGHRGCSLKTHQRSKTGETDSLHCGKAKMPWNQWPKLDPLHPELTLSFPLSALEWIKSPSFLDRAVKRLEKCEVLGFDTAGTPATILQLVGGTSSGICEIAAIVDLVALRGQLTFLSKLFTQSFGGVLVGMGTAGDVSKLSDMCGFRVTKAIVDLDNHSWGRSDIADRYYSRGLDIKGLSKIAVAVFGQSIGLRYPWRHRLNVTSSDWRRRPLKLKQIKYAIMDAYVCFKIYSATF
jgi:hypothetical protein